MKQLKLMTAALTKLMTMALAKLMLAVLMMLAALMKLLAAMLAAIFVAFGRVFAFRTAQGGGGGFNFWRVVGAACLSAVLAVGNVAFAGNATFSGNAAFVGSAIFSGGERRATDGRINLAYEYRPRNTYVGVNKGELNHKRGPDGRTSLHEVAAKCLTRQIKQIIRGGADLNIKTSKRGRTALHIAATCDHPANARALLAASADIKARDKQGRTPLHLAAESGKLRTVAALMLARADIRAKDKQGRTPLHLAATAAYPVRDRATGRQIIQRLLIAGADIHAKDKYGKTPLHAAAEANKIWAVRYLINVKRANKEAKDHNGYNVLAAAALGGARYVADRLIKEFGMDRSSLWTAGSGGMFPLHHAARGKIKEFKTDGSEPFFNRLKHAAQGGHHGNVNIAALNILFSHGATPDVRDDRGWTPLHFATRHNNLQAARILIKHKANVDAQTEWYTHKGHRALHIAALHDATDVAGLLLENGANAIYLNKNNKVPKDYAEHYFGYWSGIAHMMREAYRAERCRQLPPHVRDQYRATCNRNVQW